MKVKPVEILQRAKELGENVKATSSLNLKAVRDTANHLTQAPWREKSLGKEHLLHSMASRVGGFPPALARYFIVRYSKVGDAILDPFCGKGTTIFESLALRRRAFGGDIARDAVVMTRAKFTKVTIASVVKYIDGLTKPTTRTKQSAPPDVSLFYNAATFRELLWIRQRLLRDMKARGSRRDLANFVCGVMLGLLHGHSRFSLSVPCNQAFAMSPGYVRRYIKVHGLIKPLRDVKECLLERSLQLLPFPSTFVSDGKVVAAPAQECERYLGKWKGQIDLILTSPPYLHRQTYAKDSWLRLWFLGEKKARDVQSLETGSIPNFVEGLVVVFKAFERCLKNGGYVVLVCGRAKLKTKKTSQPVRICDLCLYALESIKPKLSLKVEELIVDKKLMVRGSYFAVHRGVESDDGETQSKRFGEDEILIIRKTR